MSDKNLEYERVDEPADKYRRILVKFNPKFMRGSDFEIEFVPLGMAMSYGRTFIEEIDTMSSVDLYRWVDRQTILTRGMNGNGCGSIVSKEINTNRANVMKRSYRQGTLELEPRQIIGRVKRWFEDIKAEFSEPVSLAYNYFLGFGELGSLPWFNKEFTIELLKKSIEEIPYKSENANGEVVERPLVEHLLDTNETEYLAPAIKNFLWAMIIVQKMVLKEAEKEDQ